MDYTLHDQILGSTHIVITDVLGNEYVVSEYYNGLKHENDILLFRAYLSHEEIQEIDIKKTQPFDYVVELAWHNVFKIEGYNGLPKSLRKSYPRENEDRSMGFTAKKSS